MVLTQPRPVATTESVPGLFFAQAARRPGRVALRRKRFGIWSRITWEEYAQQVRLVAHALLALGVQRGERVAVIGENRPEWLYADLGIQAIGAATTGIYTTSSPEQVHYILDHAGCRVFIVEGEEQLDKALEVRSRLPYLQHVVVMDPEGLRAFRDPMVIMWDQFLALGQDHARRYPSAVGDRMAEIRPDEMAVLIYTSGTTGPPKGAMLTHRNILWTTEALGRANPLLEDDEVLSFLPLAHIAERMLSVFLPARWGYTVNFIENVDTVTQNLAEVAPTVIFAVPRVWEKLYSAVTLRVGENDLFKRSVYWLAVGLSRSAVRRRFSGRPVPLWLRAAVRVADWLVLLPLRRRLGLYRARLVLSGAAPISPEMLEYFWALGVPIREIYGQTEGSGPTSVHQGDAIRLGTVGRPLPGVEVRIAEDGEILVRGGNVFAGYFRDPEATAAALRDGWLHSGDIGEFDRDGFLRITDRKKDIFITSGGKNIAPQYIENKLKASPYINDAVVIGDRQRYLVALVVIDEENVTKWAQDRRLPFTTYADLATNPEVRALIEAEVAAVNKTVSPPEQVKRFAVLTKRLYAEDDEVTPTLKVKRKAIMEKYADVIARLYRG
ncbi:MAG: AMP-binding protein [Armatimonadota bacterium]|nr:AMP-binding protein [Armatimonadota bacterium]